VGPSIILVIEDEYLLQSEVECTLADTDFAAETVFWGEEALRLFMDGNKTCARTSSLVWVRMRQATWWQLPAGW
jgi:DNA-binding response OmpR family regulator